MEKEEREKIAPRIYGINVGFSYLLFAVAQYILLPLYRKDERRSRIIS